MTCPVTLGKHVVERAVEAKPTMCFSQYPFPLISDCFFVLFTWWQSACFELGEEKCICDLSCNSVEPVQAITCKHIYFVCEKSSMSLITLVIAAEKDHGPKSV